mgnify:CR=1 FL=1
MSGLAVFLCGCFVAFEMGKIELLEKQGNNCERQLEAIQYQYLLEQAEKMDWQEKYYKTDKKYNELLISINPILIIRPVDGNSHKRTR